jgi:hypothetical protein
MTCVVGISAGETVWMGADSLGTGNIGNCSINVYKKLFRTGNFLIGCAGSPRLGQLLQYAFDPPDCEKNLPHDISCYMVTKFVDSLRKCLDAEKLKDEEKGYFLIGFKGRLFGVYQDDYQIEEDACGYNAIGIGSDLAMGSLYTTHGMDMSPRKRIEMALYASEKHNCHVQHPFVIESI